MQVIKKLDAKIEDNDLEILIFKVKNIKYVGC